MKTSPKEIRTIYERTNGYCHLCHKKVSLKNYGCRDGRGAWEIDHSRARANGGTDHGNNLLPACISCNRKKQARGSHTIRHQNGIAGVPRSKQQIKKNRRLNSGLGAFLGGALGSCAGPIGVAAGGFVGYHIGKAIPVSKM